MTGDRTVSRLWWRNRIVVGALVVLLVASGMVLWQLVRAGTAGASGAPEQSILSSGVRFRIVGAAAATPDPTVFTRTSHVVPNNRAVTITDVVLQNPHGDAGRMRILARPQTIC